MKFIQKQKLYHHLIFGLILTLVAFGCQRLDDFSNASLDFDGEYAAPLFTADINVDDIIGDLDSLTSIEIDEDGLVHLIYRGDFTQRSSTDIFASLPFLPITLSDTVTLFDYEAPNGMVLDYVIFKSGDIKFACDSPFDEDIDLEIEFPDIFDPITGETFKINNTLAYNGTTPVNLQQSVPLVGLRLVPENPYLVVKYTATKQNGERVFLNNFFLSFWFPEASYIQGYLGQELYDLPRDTIFVDFFDRWIGGGITFANPVIHMDVENSFGLPVRSVAHFLDLWTLDGQILPITGEPIANGLDFAYPSLEEVGESKHSHFVLDKDNSNVVDVFAQKPIALDYDFDALGNPDADESLIGFATDSSFFTVHVFIDLPVYGTANMFTVISDVDIETNIEEDYEFADYATLKFISENEIPMDIGLQLYFKDENGNKIDSLFDLPLAQILPEKTFIKAAGIDADGFSNSTTYNELEIEVPREKFDAFKQTNILGLVTVFDNDVNDVVRMTNKDDVRIKVGIKAGIDNE